jgi:hypothetical protein
MRSKTELWDESAQSLAGMTEEDIKVVRGEAFSFAYRKGLRSSQMNAARKLRETMITA